jgi:hypothetical protein
MTVNLDPAAAIGFVLGCPPLIGASLAMIAMLGLWLVSKLLKFAQMGLGAVAVVFLVRFVMSGGVDEVPTQKATPLAAPAAVSTQVAPEAASAVAPSPQSGLTSLIGGGEVRVDSSGFTFHVPLPGNQPVEAMLQSNQAQVQRAMAQALPTEPPARN